MKEVFLDVETANFTEGKVPSGNDGMYPFKGDRIAGIALTWDDHPEAYYIPIRHSTFGNIDLQQTQDWLRDVVKKDWINHNVVFDATFCAFEGAEFGGRLIDTLTLSKMHDSDRQGHGLKALARDWCGYDDQEEVDRVQVYLKGIKSRSFADCPVDIMGEYACLDVFKNRDLYRFLQEYRQVDESLWDHEIALTPVLYDMEMVGLRVDPQEVSLDTLKTLHSMITTSERISQITGIEFSNSNAHLIDILLNQFGLPVVATKIERDSEGRKYDTGRPTFNKEALALYSVHPEVTKDPLLVELISLIQTYRQESQHKSLFLDAFAGFHDENNMIHPHYNQVVRTGRMSCSRPNAQQQNKRSKSLIHPREGMGFISADYSQIEFRLIGHYTQDPHILDAYEEDPKTDFHQLVADMIHVKRGPGKTLNFGMAYGAGQGTVTRNLVSNDDIMAEVGEEVNAMVDAGDVAAEMRTAVFQELCEARAKDLYERYHDTFPGIKSTARQAMRNAKRRGFVFNAYGRRRHLPSRAAHKAFNSIIQGCAMDIMKDCMVSLSPRYNEKSRELGIHLAANVHDEVLIEVPVDRLEDPEVHDHIRQHLESPSVKFRVPIITDIGTSLSNWAEAAG